MKSRKKLTKEHLLKNRFLISMPNMPDNRFQKSVIFLANITDKEVQGFIFNKKLSNVTLENLSKELKFPILTECNNTATFNGGPVEPHRGLVLHSNDSNYESTQAVTGGVSLTFHPQILADIALAKGPRDFIILLGHASWSLEQLESEIVQNAWLQVSLPESFLFSDSSITWEDAIKYCFPDANSAAFSAKTGYA